MRGPSCRFASGRSHEHALSGADRSGQRLRGSARPHSHDGSRDGDGGYNRANPDTDTDRVPSGNTNASPHSQSDRNGHSRVYAHIHALAYTVQHAITYTDQHVLACTDQHAITCSDHRTITLACTDQHALACADQHALAHRYTATCHVGGFCQVTNGDAGFMDT